MEWLGNNWMWLAFAAAVFAFFALGRGGCGMSHGGHAQPEPQDQGDQRRRHGCC